MNVNHLAQCHIPNGIINVRTADWPFRTVISPAGSSCSKDKVFLPFLRHLIKITNPKAELKEVNSDLSSDIKTRRQHISLVHQKLYIYVI